MRVIFLEQNPVMGKLQIEDTFLSYDGPRLFSAVNGAGQRFLVNCLDADEREEIWIAVAISDRRLSALKDRQLPLRDAFTSPELGSVIWFSTSDSGELIMSEIVDPSKLTDLVLPDVGVYLPQVGTKREVVNATFLARTLKSNIVLLRLFPNSDKHEASAALVGGILSSFSDYLFARIDAAYAEAQQRLAANIAGIKPEVNIVGTFAGSLGVEIVVRGDESLVRNALRSAVGDLAFAHDAPPLRDKMVIERRHQADLMRRFLQQVSSGQSDLSVETASDGDESAVGTALPLETVKETLKHLKAVRALDNSSSADERPAPVMLLAELTGLSLRSKTFELRILQDGTFLKGSMASEVFSDVSRAELPSRYRVVIQGNERNPDDDSKPYGKLRMLSATRLK